MVHVPVVQVFSALARVQAVPHAPQFVVLVPTFVSQPFDAFESQSAYEVLHAKPQVLLAQVADAFGGMEHAVVHDPQWFTSDARLKHATCAGQYIVDAPQELTHVPPEQNVPAAHAVPQAPQLASVLSAASQPLE